MENFNRIKEIVAAAEADVAKFNTGNASAGTRVRAKMQEIRKLCQDVRKEVQEKKNEAKPKK
jgi:hypothetical protein